MDMCTVNIKLAQGQNLGGHHMLHYGHDPLMFANFEHSVRYD